MADQNQRIRIESEAEVRAYLERLKFALDHGAYLQFQAHRRVDKKKKSEIHESIHG